MHKDTNHNHFLKNVKSSRSGKILTVRAHSGLSGDMFLTGLTAMSNTSQEELDGLLACLNMEALNNCLEFTHKYVNHIYGLHTKVHLPFEHSHRSLKDILLIIEQSSFSDSVKELCINCFDLLAKTEAKIHGKQVEDVTFHEVGALDSIVDICISCALFDKISPDHFISSPLPLADGSIYCAHGYIPSPAPAVFELLNDVKVTAFNGEGETITPTAIALLKTFNVEFDSWIDMKIEKTAIVYGTKVFPNVANGSLWALGNNDN